MNKLKYIHRGDGDKRTVISGDFLARCIVNRSVGMVGFNDESTMFQFTLSDGGQFRIKIEPSSPEIHYFPPSKR